MDCNIVHDNNIKHIILYILLYYTILYYTILYFHILLRFANITQFYSTNGIICIQDGPSDIECKSVLRMTLFSNCFENYIISITF